VVDFAAGALMDVGTNLNEGLPHNQGVACTETADTVLPNVLRARLNYGTGVLEIDADETVDTTANSLVNLANLFVADSTGDDYVSLVGAVVSGADALTFTVTLNEAQRATAVVKSGVFGGDGTALVLDAKANAVQDIATNNNDNDLGLTITEIPDVIRPTILGGAVLSLGTGVLRLTASESVLHHAIDVDGINIVNHLSVYTLALSPSQTITQSAGVLVTQPAAETTWRITLSPSVVVAANKGAGVSQNGHMTWTMTINPSTIIESQGVVVTQLGATGTLTTALTGANRVTVSITSAIGQVFDTNDDLVIDDGGTPTTILAADVTNAASVTTSNAAGTLKNAVGNIWTMTFASGQTISEAKGLAVTQANGFMTWTLTINSATINENQGESVSQIRLTYPNNKISTGTLHTELTGAGMVEVVITTAEGVTFDTTRDLTVGSTVISASDITAASFVSQGGATGLTSTALSGTTTTFDIVAAPGVAFDSITEVVIGGTTVAANLIQAVGASSASTTSFVEIVAAAGQTFDLLDDLVVDSTTINAAGLQTIASYNNGASGTLKTELTGGSMTSIEISVNSGIFHTNADLVVGSTTVLASVINTATYDNYVTEVPLSGASLLIPAGRQTHFDITLTEAQRVRAIEISGQPGGDSVKAALLIYPYRFSDLSHNYNDQEFTVEMVENPDTILPTITGALIDLENGVMTVTTSETVDVTPGSLVDVTKFELHQVSDQDEWTLVINGQKIKESQGASVSQTGGATGTLTTALTNIWTFGINPQSLTYLQGDTVTQGSTGDTSC
jgi:hypothetical protein